MSYTASRIEKLRAFMKEQGLDALFLRNISNIAWASGFEGVFDTEPAHALMVTAECCLIHSDSRYVTALEATAHGTPIQVSAERISHFEALRKFMAPAAARVGIEDGITLSEFRKLERDAAEASIELVELTGAVERLREVKDASELFAMRAAQRITDAAFTHIVRFIRPGMTERAVQLELDRFMLEQGADGLAFDTIVAIGPHAASPHAIPGQTPIEEGQAIVMDFGAKANGYCSDMTRTVFMGEPCEETRRAWDALRRANEECEAALRAGVTGRQAHELAERALEEGGFGGRMGHSLGHGVGLDVHEAPLLSPRNGEPLKAGNVVTVEPGIYLPGAFGMRLEDFGVVTEGGYDVFTQSTHEMVVL